MDRNYIVNYCQASGFRVYDNLKQFCNKYEINLNIDAIGKIINIPCFPKTVSETVNFIANFFVEHPFTPMEINKDSYIFENE